MRALVVLLVACGGKASPQEPASIGNKATPTAAEPEQVGCAPRGMVIDAAIGEQAIGATVVFSGGPHEQVAISDDKGQFWIDTDPSHNRVTVYYNDRTFEWAFMPSYCHTRMRITLDPPNAPQTPIIPY